MGAKVRIREEKTKENQTKNKNVLVNSIILRIFAASGITF
jgi:hypothetical protein